MQSGAAGSDNTSHYVSKQSLCGDVFNIHMAASRPFDDFFSYSLLFVVSGVHKVSSGSGSVKCSAI